MLNDPDINAQEKFKVFGGPDQRSRGVQLSKDFLEMAEEAAMEEHAATACSAPLLTLSSLFL